MTKHGYVFLEGPPDQEKLIKGLWTKNRVLFYKNCKFLKSFYEVLSDQKSWIFLETVFNDIFQEPSNQNFFWKGLLNHFSVYLFTKKQNNRLFLKNYFFSRVFWWKMERKGKLFFQRHPDQKLRFILKMWRASWATNLDIYLRYFFQGPSDQKSSVILREFFQDLPYLISSIIFRNIFTKFLT